MYKAYRIVAGTEQVLRNSVLPALSLRKGRSFHLFFIHKTWTFIKPLSMSGSELEVMISLNSPITQWEREHCHVLMMRSERSSNSSKATQQVHGRAGILTQVCWLQNSILFTEFCGLRWKEVIQAFRAGGDGSGPWAATWVPQCSPLHPDACPRVDVRPHNGVQGTFLVEWAFQGFLQITSL